MWPELYEYEQMLREVVLHFIIEEEERQNDNEEWSYVPFRNGLWVTVISQGWCRRNVTYRLGTAH